LPNLNESLLSPAGKLLAGLRARRPWQAELYARREARREIAWAEGKPKDTVSERSEGMALRVMRGGRQGFAFGREISSATGKLLWDRARELMPCVPSDRFRRLPSPAAVRNGWVPPPASPMFRQDVKELQERLAESERRLLRADRRIKKVLDLSVE
jgi:predicted Zn-dependent protease